MPIKVTCAECGRIYNLDESRAGQTLACKKCGADMEVPEEELEEAESIRERTSRTKKKSGSMLPLLIGGGVVAFLLLLVVCGGVIAYFLTRGGGGGSIVSSGDKVTPENFSKVKRGMSEKDVTALLGPPQQGVPSIPGLDEQMKDLGQDGAKKLSWSGKNNLNCHVIVVNGTVQGALGTDGSNVYAPLLADGGQVPPIDHQKPKGGTGVVTQPMVDAFAKVRPGMNEKQVVALLGPADSRNSIAAQEGGGLSIPASVFLTWGRLSGDHINVTLRDDKVTNGNGSFQNKRLTLTK